MSPITMATDIVPSTSGIFTATVVVAGFGIVLLMLCLLIAVFYAFGAIVSKSEKAAKARKDKKSAKDTQNTVSEVVSPAPMPVSAPAPVAETQDGISEEVVAAISAAIYMNEGSGVVIRSIKKKTVGSRNPWANAAVLNNTKPF